MMNYGYWNSGPGSGGWLVMLVFMVIFWGAIAWIVLTVLHQRHGHDHGHGHLPVGAENDPFRILDQRLARGEIDEEEYKRRRDLLKPGA